MKRINLCLIITGMLCSSMCCYPVCSAAESDADNSVVTITGDINSDGIADLTDYSLLSLFLLNDIDLSDVQKKAADVDFDGALSITDLARFKQYVMKELDSFEQEEEPKMVPNPDPNNLPIPDRGPLPEVFPVNREDGTYDRATMNNIIYYKKGISYFSESQIINENLSAFIEDDLNQSGMREFVKTVDGISADEFFIVKCGKEEGKYFTFFNEKLLEQEIEEILEKIQ